MHIAPDGHVQVVTGRNGQGKTSVLDAIWLALGGGTASRDTRRPIRDGEDRAHVTLNLGDLVVTRTWRGDKTTLTVKSRDGASFSSPQKMLDRLIGRLSFDPLAFTRLPARDQVAALLDIVDLDVDLDDLDAERASVYEHRTRVGRDVKSLGDVHVDESIPDAETSATELLDRIRQASQVEDDRQRAERAEAETVRSIEAIEEQIAALEHRRAESMQHRDELRQTIADMPAPVDVESLMADLDGIEEANARVRENNRLREVASLRDEKDREYAHLTARLEDIDAIKAGALAAATFPVDGLGFDQDGVTFKGVPFSQASAAEQIRVSLAMAMALNPELRVIRIDDGSLLDDESMGLVAEMAEAGDYQVWVERVADASDSAVVIEDGSVVGDES